MKKFTILSLIALFLVSASSFAQTVVTGTIVVVETDSPLPGANVLEVGTSNGVTTDFDGNFTLTAKSATGKVTISYVGYTTRTILFDGTTSLGTVVLSPDNTLDEIIITGVVDLAKDRKTPVAVSTVRAKDIQQKLGSQEFPEILNNTPSIYATKQGGGYGDSRINIRGFDTNNSAVMINGVPVNDMENGRVFWSNWAGLSDVASAIQVQRGLGSSKLAVSSVGGTINVVTRSSEREQGGFISSSIGNNNYWKKVASYSTGQNEKGWSSSYLLSRTRGDGFVDATEFEGYNYFMAVGYQPNDKSTFEFTIFGAPQWHHQRSFAPTIRDYIRFGNGNDPDIKYNGDWGFRNGETFNFRRNFYHKPVISLNYDYQINDKMKLSTSTYASFGRGGGTGEIGEINGRRQFALPRTEDGLIRVDDIVAYNSGALVPDFSDQPRETINGLFLNNSDRNPNENNTNGITRRSSINSHNWYGFLGNLNTQVNENLTIDFGLDLRKYKGFHYRRVNDRLGGTAYQQTDNRNNPIGEGASNIFFETYNANQPWWVFGNIDDEEKIDYYNIGYVNWIGAFGQMEYTKDALSLFVQGAISNQGFAREELFGVAPAEKTDFENILGGNVKAGLNYNINDNHNVFVNGGYYSKQPLFDSVYLNFGNNLNPNLTNEKVIGMELGYGFRSSNFRANVNLYRTSWSDRFETVGATFNEGEPNEVRGTANILGITQVHMGLEVDFRYNLYNKLALTGQVSLGNWEYKDNVQATFFDNDQSPILIDGVAQEEILFLDGVKVGDAAQTTFSLGVDYSILDNLSVDANYRYADNLYADFDATDINEEGSEALELPSFGLLDAGISYQWNLSGGKNISFRVNMNNVLDEIYISESETNIFEGERDTDVSYDGINTRNRVYFGQGRTWNGTIRYNF